MEKTNISHRKKEKNMPLGKAGGKTCPFSPSSNLGETQISLKNSSQCRDGSGDRTQGKRANL